MSKYATPPELLTAFQNGYAAGMKSDSIKTRDTEVTAYVHKSTTPGSRAYACGWMLAWQSRGKEFR
jgi:hypothetical protein